MGKMLQEWKGRQFQGKCSVRHLHSDSSSHGWAGVDLKNGGAVQEFWRDQQGLHINVKELMAAIHTVKSLARPERNSHPFSGQQCDLLLLAEGGGGNLNSITL